MARTKASEFWPCTPVYDDDTRRLAQVVFTAFERLGRTAPRATTGYAVERLVKKLAKARDPTLLRRVRFDPEADMFCVYGDDPKALLAIAKLVRGATGQRPPRPGGSKAKLAPAAARDALRRGFIQTLDAKAQAAFLRGWPRPRDSGHDRILRELASRDREVRLAGARHINRAACRCIGNIAAPLSHPTTFDAVMRALEREQDPKIHDELAYALAMMVKRACPDLRTAPIFERLLACPRASVRAAAAVGLGTLAVVDWAAVLPWLDDPLPEVRGRLCALGAFREFEEEPHWILRDAAVKRTPPLPRSAYPVFVKLLDDEFPRIRCDAAHALRDTGAVELAGELDRRAKREKLTWVRDVFRADAAVLRRGPR